MSTPSPQNSSYDELLVLSQQQAQRIESQAQKIEALNQKLAWLSAKVFGEQSEVFHRDDSSVLSLFPESEIQNKPAAEKEVSGYTRKTRGKTGDLGENQDSGLRFDDGVDIFEEFILPDEAKGLSPEEYDIIGEDISDTLASRTTRNFIHRRRYQKIKLKTPAAGDAGIKQAKSEKIFPGSYLEISFIVDMLLDKTLYSVPLYRQHQRLKQDGVYLARSTLTANFIRYAQLLEPLMEPLQLSILLSRILALDETPMKVGVDRKKHKMKTGYIWPVMGDKAEIIYLYSDSRAAKVLEELLAFYSGTILSDGYSAYESYVNSLLEQGRSDCITHATCWVHARRKFVALGEDSPVFQKAMRFFAELYEVEARLNSKNRSEVLEARMKVSAGIVDRYFDWLRSFGGAGQMATNNTLRKAVSYSLKREDSMRVFLRDPELPLDTNHLEREIRPIAIGRKNFMFCWSEVGAESLCIIQSLVRTCVLQGIKPREYLIDVIQRIAQRNPETDDLSDLIPTIWKEEFQGQAIRCPGEITIEKVNSEKLSAQNMDKKSGKL